MVFKKIKNQHRVAVGVMKILPDTCIWSGAKGDLETAGYDVKWVGDFLVDRGDEVIIQLAHEEGRVHFRELAVFRGAAHCGIIRLVGFSALEHGSFRSNFRKV